MSIYDIVKEIKEQDLMLKEKNSKTTLKSNSTVSVQP
jgi:hypothetical protein